MSTCIMFFFFYCDWRCHQSKSMLSVLWLLSLLGTSYNAVYNISEMVISRSSSSSLITVISFFMVAYMLPSAPPLKPTPFIRDDSACACTYDALHELACVFFNSRRVCVCVCVITVPQNTLWKVFMALTRAVKNLELSAALTPLP